MKPILSFVLLLILFVSCKQDRKEAIQGTWRVVYHDPSVRMRRQITMEFRKDQKLMLDVANAGGQLDHHEGTYELDKDGKTLIVYREGNTQKKNQADIVELTGNSLVLVDRSANSRGDTMWLEKIR